MATRTSYNLVPKLYRRISILERKVSFRPANNPHGERFLQQYLRYKFHAPSAPQQATKLKSLSEKYLEYRQSVQNYTVRAQTNLVQLYDAHYSSQHDFDGVNRSQSEYLYTLIRSIQDLLIKYKMLNPMEEREYVKRQAAHVGLELPTFQDEKADTGKFTVKTKPPISGVDPSSSSTKL